MPNLKIGRAKTTALYILVQNIVNAIFQLIIVVVVSQVLGAEATGQYSLAQSYVLPAFFLGLFALKTQYTISRDIPDTSDYFSIRTIGGLLVFLVMIPIIYVFEDKYILELSLALALIKYLDGYVDIMVAVYQRSRKPSLIFKTAVIRSTLLMVTFLSVFFVTYNLVLALTAAGLIGIANFILFEYQLCKKYSLFISPVFSFKSNLLIKRIKIAKQGIPISLAILIGAAQTSIIRIVLENECGYRILGQFSATLQIILIGNLFITAVGQSLIPNMSNFYIARDKNAFIKLLGLITAVLLVCVFLALALSLQIGDWVMAFVFGNDFNNQGKLLSMGIVASSTFFLNAVLTQAVIACNQAVKQLYVYMVGLAVTTLLSFTIISSMGAQGAYLTLFSISLVQVIIFLVLIHRSFRFG